MNMNLNLSLDPKKILPFLQQAQPYLFGLALIGIFAYTAWTVNAALNVKPATTAVTATDTAGAITFDKNTIAALKNLNVVQGEVPTGSLGTDNPFK